MFKKIFIAIRNWWRNSGFTKDWENALDFYINKYNKN